MTGALRFAVVGAGRQGTAAAYDLARFTEGASVVLADIDPKRAHAAADRVNGLVSRQAARGVGCDIGRERDVTKLFAQVDAVLSAVPYWWNDGLAAMAMVACVHFTDLGGNTAVVKRELALHAEARKAGVSLVPDLGLAPGMSNILAAYAVSRQKNPRDVVIRCGGLPEHPRPPLGYRLVFSAHGLTNEYMGEALVLREGRVARISTLTEAEEIDLPGIGRLEARITSGGTSTCPESFRKKLRSYSYKTLRYPGHFALIEAAKTLGLLDEEPVAVETPDGPLHVSPRLLFHSLLSRQCSYEDTDLVILEVEVSGGDGTIRIDLIDRHDPETGFSAMERTTGFPAAIVSAMQARGEIAPGAKPPEKAVPGEAFLAELEKRGIRPKIDKRDLSEPATA